MDQVGRYQILTELGRGAHGVVYKALDPAIGRTIAIKAIALGDIHTADRELVREGILREARLAGTLTHPNIVTVYDVVDRDDAAFIVMEFVDGESMESAIATAKERRPDKLTRAGFLSIFRQVAQALDYAHRKGVIHRDVKPANIVLTDQRGGELLAKIADFGVAKFSSHDGTQPGSSQTLVGTPNYMSPEQVAGESVSGASDQFSLAVIAYEVLTGRKAFTADSLETLLYRIRHEPEEPVDKLNLALSPTVTKVMHRALAKHPDDRFSTCGEFAGALEFALGDSPKWLPGGSEYAPTQIADSPLFASLDQAPDLREEYPRPDRTWLKTIALLAAMALAVGLALVLIVRMNSGSPLPTQVLDTRSAPVSPPPPVEELKYDRRQANELPTPDNAPTVVKVAPPAEAVKRKPIPVRQVKQIASSGDVQLLTDPPGANVTVDGFNSCTTPCSLKLASGRHTLAASMSGFGIARKIFYVPADLDIFIPLVKSVGVLIVSSEPSGATVNVDGRSAGTTPLTLRLAPGSHRLSVWDGARWHDESIQVSGDAVNTRTFRF